VNDDSGQALPRRPQGPTVASFRIWRGSQVYVAQDPTLYIIARDMGPLA